MRRANPRSGRDWRDRVKFEVAKAKEFPGKGLRFRGGVRLPARYGRSGWGGRDHVRSAMAEDGTWMIVEPFANDELKDNLNPVGRVYYSFSTLLCTPCSRSQEVGMCLGAQAGEKARPEGRNFRWIQPLPARDANTLQSWFTKPVRNEEANSKVQKPNALACGQGVRLAELQRFRTDSTGTGCRPRDGTALPVPSQMSQERAGNGRRRLASGRRSGLSRLRRARWWSIRLCGNSPARRRCCRAGSARPGAGS